MEHLKNILNSPDVRGVLRSTTGEIMVFHNPGVKDLFNLIAEKPQLLNDADAADRVIGRGAALLMVLGKVKRVYARFVSEQAIRVLQEADIKVEYEKSVPNIINRDGTDICPVEKLTMNVTDPKVAFVKIEEFLITNNIIES